MHYEFHCTFKSVWIIQKVCLDNVLCFVLLLEGFSIRLKWHCEEASILYQFLL